MALLRNVYSTQEGHDLGQWAGGHIRGRGSPSGSLHGWPSPGLCGPCSPAGPVEVKHQGKARPIHTAAADCGKQVARVTDRGGVLKGLQAASSATGEMTAALDPEGPKVKAAREQEEVTAPPPPPELGRGPGTGQWGPGTRGHMWKCLGAPRTHSMS